MRPIMILFLSPEPHPRPSRRLLGSSAGISAPRGRCRASVNLARFRPTGKHPYFSRSASAPRSRPGAPRSLASTCISGESASKPCPWPSASLGGNSMFRQSAPGLVRVRRNRSLTPSFFEIESERRPCAPPSLPCVRASMWAMAAILCAVAAIMCETTAIMCATAAILSITFASMCATAAIMCAHRRVHVCHWTRTCSARATRTRSVAQHVRVGRTYVALARDPVRHNRDHVQHGRVHVVSTSVRSVSAVAGDVSATRSLGTCPPRDCFPRPSCALCVRYVCTMCARCMHDVCTMYARCMHDVCTSAQHIVVVRAYSARS